MFYKPSGPWVPPFVWHDPAMVNPSLDEVPFSSMRGMAVALEVKRRSLFCLEPPGANPIRRSMYDSLLSGCIPVLFMTADEHAAFLPPAFFARRANMSVRIDPDDMARGLDLRAHLAHLNQSGHAARLRRTIARHAHRLVYSLDGGFRGDASDRFVEELRARVEASEAYERSARQSQSRLRSRRN